MRFMEVLSLINMAQAFSRGALALVEFDNWIVLHLPSFLPPHRDAASQLAGLIQLWVAELNQGHRNQDEIRALVGDYMREHAMFMLSEDLVIASSQNEAVQSPVMLIPVGPQIQTGGVVLVASRA